MDNIFNIILMTNNNINHEFLHGVTLSTILDVLIEDIGFQELSEMVRINCFAIDPSKQSCLKFLRKTEWARLQVQGVYVKHMYKKRKYKNK